MKRLIIACILLYVAGASYGQAPRCEVVIIDQSTSRTLSCTIELLDDSEQVLIKKKRADGRFDLVALKSQISRDACELKISFENKDYFPVTKTQLRCPISCDQRIIAKKKADFSKIR